MWSGCAFQVGSPYGESPFRQKAPTLATIRKCTTAKPGSPSWRQSCEASLNCGNDHEFEL